MKEEKRKRNNEKKPNAGKGSNDSPTAGLSRHRDLCPLIAVVPDAAVVVVVHVAVAVRFRDRRCLLVSGRRDQRGCSVDFCTHGARARNARAYVRFRSFHRPVVNNRVEARRVSRDDQ